MAKHNHREMDRIERLALSKGFIVRRTANQHLRIINPKIKPGPGVRNSAMWSSAHSDGRSGQNSRAELKAIGLVLPVNL
jgi:hypothetical protein